MHNVKHNKNQAPPCRVISTAKKIIESPVSIVAQEDVPMIANSYAGVNYSGLSGSGASTSGYSYFYVSRINLARISSRERYVFLFFVFLFAIVVPYNQPSWA